MKQIQLLMLLLLTAMLGVPIEAQADREVNQLQFGKQVVTVTSDEEITFYDFMGTSDIPSSSSSNSQSLTVFKPAESGKSIQITFSEIDIIPDMSSGSYPAFMKVYSGTPDDSNITWATKAGDVQKDSPLPDGNVLVTRGGMVNSEAYSSTAAETYISEADDGSLAVGFIYVYAKKCKGWKATVKCVTLENMTVTGAGSSYDNVSATITKKQNVDLATAYVTTSGIMNPDKVTSVSFTLTQNEGMVDPTALKLFYGDKAISATVSEEGSGYKFTLNQALSDGTNNFVIKGDILGTAEIGAKVQLDITKITTEGQPEGITPFTAGTSVAVENPALVIMTATPQTITVGETPLQFYDEGGKDGGIVSKTNGQVTFLSGVEGKKVMVDFTSNKIWHGSLYNQELRIYNGTEVNEANLIKTLQQGEAELVRSTAEDGSLTVVLFSDASNEVAADGFEATVSLFTPQPMDFDGITSAAASTGTVAGGDADQDMLTITVDALNTEPAMKVTKMIFSAGETADLVEKATLYFGTTKVGETAVEGSAFEINLTTPQALVEGSNVFTLKYTISDEALNDKKVSATLNSVIALVNNAEKTETLTSPTAVERTVKNMVLNHADQGTVTKTVNGSLAFETKPKSEYSTTYETGTDDRINIFIPKHEGMVCQIDFESFKIYYYSYNVSSSAKFKIYNGQGTTGEVLWEPTTQSDYSNGPGQIIRSTAADGSLTVVFNPNQSYSTNDGWKATVSEYLSKDMAVTAIEATQASTADASIGASDQELLNVNVKTEGNLNALSMSSIHLNLQGTEANISKVSVWQGETKLGEAAAAAEVTVIFSEAVTLVEGDNTFVVKVDVNSDAEENSTIDAKVVSITAGSAIEATNGDPEGARTLKNQILLTAGDHGTINLGLGNITTLYDDGGPDGDGADGVEATITIAPTGEAESIKLTDKGINFSSTSYVYIYEGSEVNDGKLLLTLNGSSAKFDPLIVDGPVTIKYIGKGSYIKPNIAIQAEGYKKSDVVVTGVTTEDISVNKVLIGQTDAKMLKIVVEAKGELTPAEVTDFNITGIDGVAVDAYHIYQTGTTDAFSPVSEFSDSYSITESGTYYFWLTYNVKSDAEVNQTATATVNSVVVNGNTIEIAEPATASFTVASGKHGIYIVGGEGADYATIQGAIDDIGSLGMDGSVTLKIKAGEYNEKVRIPNIKGMGGVNTLTIESESGERDVKIYHNNYTTAGYSDDQHKKDYGVVTLYQANYVTLKNLEITTTDLNYKAVVMIKDESRHATIDNCYLHTGIYASTSGDGPALVGHTIIDEENRNNDHLTIRNSLLEGGKYGAYIGGTSSVALPKEVGGVIDGNTFKNNGRFMLYSYDELGVKIRNNTFIIDNDEVKLSNGVIDINVRDEHLEATEITGNIFNLNSANTVTAFYIRQMEGTATAPAIIANNVVNLVSANASCCPFKFNGNKMKYVNVANNTFRMTGTNGGAAFWASSALANGYGNINVVNNIIQNETSGYAVNLYNDGNLSADKINFQNNVMYTAGETFFRASTSTTGDFDTFVEKTGATGCINKQVSFLSENVLEPANTLYGDLLTAVALDYVTTDINGKARPTENITIGAYEYDTNADAAPVMAETYPQVLTHLDGKASFSVKTDLAATVYYLVKKSSETAPTAEELKASETKKDVTANAEAIIEVDELEDNAEYIAYFLPISLRGVQAETMSQTATFIMEVTPPVTDAPTVEAYLNDYESEVRIEAGDDVLLFGMYDVDERTAPYTITWMDSKHNVIESETIDDYDDIESFLMANVNPTESTDYIFTVTDAAEKSATASVRVIVEGDLQVATFENLWTDPEDGFWMGDFSKGVEGSTFVSGSFRFSNFASDTYGGEPTTPFWGNYAYSQTTTNTFSSYIIDQFNNAVGGGVDNSETFLVAYPQGGTIDVINNENGAVIPGMYITNNAWVVDAILHGDGMSTADGTETGAFTGNIGFQTGDWFLLTITADNGKSIEYYLADYRSADETQHYYVNDWQWLDLSSLGTVKSLSFFLTSSRRNKWGTTTPSFFCLDNIGAEEPAGNGITTNIKGTQVEESAEGIYSIDGKVLTQGSKQKGVQLIRMKDGSIRKVVR